ISVRGNRVSITLARSSETFLDRLALPFFCTVPSSTPSVDGGLPRAPPSAGPYYMSETFNGEYTILKRNPNYRGPRRGRLDAIAFRQGISPEHAVERVHAGTWDGAILDDSLLAPGSVVSRRASESPDLRTEDLVTQDPTHARGDRPLHALLGTRIGCDTVKGALDLAALCIRN
ncbi:MAG: Bacterial extracellular solute-binding protein family 5 Middle, partial [Gaiellales bacterium]|nr:Bacterial extracellular solute-binding protein family 5 Middle [Gaiellales bacterium]